MSEQEFEEPCGCGLPICRDCRPENFHDPCPECGGKDFGDRRGINHALGCVTALGDQDPVLLGVPNAYGEYDSVVNRLIESNDYRAALELIAAPMRPDGTWNRDRAACRDLARKALGYGPDDA